MINQNVFSQTEKEKRAMKRKRIAEKVYSHVFSYSKIYGSIGYIVCILSGVFRKAIAEGICNICGDNEIASAVLSLLFIIFILFPSFLCAVARTHLLFLEISMDMDEVSKQKRNEENA